jgi:hypothetical protein
MCGEVRSVFIMSDYFKIDAQINPFRMAAANAGFMIVQKWHPEFLLHPSYDR